MEVQCCVCRCAPGCAASQAWGVGEEGGFLRGPRIHLMLHQQRGREGPPWPRQSSWLHTNAASDKSRL